MASAPRSALPDDGTTLDDLLATLADDDRCLVVEHLHHATAPPSFEDIVERLAEERPDRDHLAIRLHHAILPRLDRVGLLDYDPDARTIAWHGDCRLALLLQAAPPVDD